MQARRLAVIFTASVGLASAQTQVDWNTQIRNKPTVSSNATSVAQTNSGTTGVGGYIQIQPTTYPNLTCFDKYGNPVNVPKPLPGFPAFGPNDVIMWNSQSNLSGVVPPGCATTLPPNLNLAYGLNINTYLLSSSGLATTNDVYNSIQSLGGGMIANSYTAGTLYAGPLIDGQGGTVVCTAMTGSACTATRTLTTTEYLGGHVDIGHSNGPPICTGGYPCVSSDRNILTAVNPLSGGEGLVQGMMYWDDGLHCVNVYSGTAWACIGSGGGSGSPGAPVNSVQFNNASAFGGSSNFTWNNSIQVLAIVGTATSGVDAPVFSSSNTGSNLNFTNSNGTFTINGAGAGAFQSLAVGTGSPFTISTAGDTVLHNVTINGTCTGCGAGNPAGSNTQVQYNSSGVFAGSSTFTFAGNTLTLSGASNTGVVAPTFNSTNTGATNAFQTQAGTMSITGAGNALFQNVTVHSVFNSQADVNGGNAFQTSGGNAFITGAGGGGFQTLAVGSGNPFTVSVAGDTVLHNVTINGTCTGCGAGNPAGSSTQVQFNSSGVFGGSSGLTWNGATLFAANLSIAGICSGCGAGGGVSSFNTRTGAVTLQNSDIVSVAQDLRTSASPTFQAVTSTTLFNCAATGASNCVQQSSGFFSINGQGDFLGQSVTTGSNNGSVATGGRGAVFSKTGSTVSALFYDSSGVCGIGTGETAPGIACTSDQRLKTPGISVSEGLDPVMRLRPVTFKWLGSGKPGVGFIAQEVQKVLPGLISMSPDNYLMLSEDGIIPYLVRAIQQQQAEIDELKARSGGIDWRDHGYRDGTNYGVTLTHDTVINANGDIRSIR